jgi:hypothetical protein
VIGGTERSPRQLHGVGVVVLVVREIERFSLEMFLSWSEADMHILPYKPSCYIEKMR